MKENFNIVVGDLFELTGNGNFDVIAQGNNCFNRQGAGIAVLFKKHFKTDKFKMELSGEGDKNKLGLGLYLQYIGKMAMNYDENSVQKMSSPYYVLSGYAKYKVSNNICLSFNINNILNKKYYIPAGVLNESLFYVGELLNYKLSLNVKI